MTDEYRIFGAEVSPYSVKVRSYCRYKGIPHQWIVRTQERMGEFSELAKLPLIPLVVTPEGEAWQDSTPILEKLDRRHPEPSIHPGETRSAFVSVLLEEFGDEWGNKWMFHYRWAREVDQRSGAERIALSLRPDAEGEELARLADGVRERMVGRVWFVGSSAETAPQIEASFRQGVERLERHLADRPYLFGERPAFGDFGLWPQLYEAWSDPTPGALLEENAPRVVAWVERMLEPAAAGPFEPWERLAPTLEPFLAEQVGGRFLPWSAANARAIAADREEFAVELAGQTFTQKPQKYHAKSLAALREKYAAVADDAPLASLLERCGCLEWLR